MCTESVEYAVVDADEGDYFTVHHLIGFYYPTIIFQHQLATFNLDHASSLPAKCKICTCYICKSITLDLRNIK